MTTEKGCISQVGPGSQRRKVQSHVSAEGLLNCHLLGNDFKEHLLLECQKFWYLPVEIERNLLNKKSCWACLGPQGRPHCTANPPEDMMCSHCRSSNQRFIPAVPLCLNDSHRNQTDSDKTVIAMQRFFKDKFIAQHFDAHRLMNKSTGSI